MLRNVDSAISHMEHACLGAHQKKPARLKPHLVNPVNHGRFTSTEDSARHAPHHRVDDQLEILRRETEHGAEAVVGDGAQQLKKLGAVLRVVLKVAGDHLRIPDHGLGSNAVFALL